ncbi:hypothetical protein E4U09_005039, partial [Claviceps aff. purpurea]
MSAITSSISVVMPTPVKHHQNVGSFNGGEDVQRWLKKVQRAYRLANVGMSAH